MATESFSIHKGGDLRHLFAYISGLIFRCDIKVTVEESRETRSQQQNAYLWTMYQFVLNSGGESMAGWTKDDLHELVLIEHFGSTELKAFGRRRLKPKRRSSRLSTVEFIELVDFVHRYFAEYGIVIPDPDPNWRAQLQAQIVKKSAA